MDISARYVVMVSRHVVWIKKDKSNSIRKYGGNKNTNTDFRLLRVKSDQSDFKLNCIQNTAE